MDLEKLIRNIPDYQQFLTVEEMDASTMKLAEEYPDLVTVTEEGRSRKYTFSGSVYFERMKEIGRYSTDTQEIRSWVEKAGMLGVFDQK